MIGTRGETRYCHPPRSQIAGAAFWRNNRCSEVRITCAKRIRFFRAVLAYFVFAENRCSQFAVLFIDRGSIIPVQSRTIRAESNVPRCQVGIEFLHDWPRNAENEKASRAVLGPGCARAPDGKPSLTL